MYCICHSVACTLYIYNGSDTSTRDCKDISGKNSVISLCTTLDLDMLCRADLEQFNEICFSLEFVVYSCRSRRLVLQSVPSFCSLIMYTIVCISGNGRYDYVVLALGSDTNSTDCKDIVATIQCVHSV